MTLARASAQLSERRRILSAMGGGAAFMALQGCGFFSTDPDAGAGAGAEEDARDPEALEAPELADRVADGTLPALEDRLPTSPLIVDPLNSPGEYGGTLTGVSLGLTSSSDVQVAMTTGFFRYSEDVTDIYPELAEGYDFSGDFRTFVIYLREGVRWSDGELFTADDVVFYFEDWQFNTDLMPVPSSQWMPGDELMTVAKVDDLTVQFNFAIPNPAFSILNYSAAPVTPYAPKHYLSQFLPAYNDEAQEAAVDEGFNDWQDKFLAFTSRYTGQQRTELPVLDPWILTESSDQRQRYERNPYYWQVDTDGRQLPYISNVNIDYVTDMEVVQLRAQSGDVSVAGRDLELTNYPMLKDGEEDGGYRAALLSLERGSEFALAFNMEHKDDVLREIFTDVRFRQAASVAINREEINQVVFLGQGVPRQATINDSASFFKQEWADAYADHDPDLANRLLDEIGLSERDDDGIRLRPDGSRLSFQVEFDPRQGPKRDALELVIADWREVGLDVGSNPREAGYLETRLQAGDQDASAWHVDRTLERTTWAYGWQTSKLGPGGNSALAYAYGWEQWLVSNGQEGIEPPDEAKEVHAAFEEWQRHEEGSPDYERLGQFIHDMAAETLWVIGTVGQGPAGVLVKNGLENVFSEEVFQGEQTVWWGAANWYWLPHRIQQWYWT